MDLEERIMELSRYGYACGQILAILLLDTVGEDNQHKAGVGGLTRWFTEEMELEHMSIDCRDIVGTNPAKKVQYCPGIIAATYEKCMAILEDRGLL